jgi:uncharacterized membrane protein
MVYNVTLVANSSGVLDFVQNVNTHIMDGWFGTLIMIAFFVIMFGSIMFKTNNARQAFAASSFICFGLSLFLLGLGLIPNLVLFVSLMMAAFAIAILKAE